MQCFFVFLCFEYKPFTKLYCPIFFVLLTMQNPKRVVSRNFLIYVPPPDSCSPAVLEEFLERADFITKDLQWLLSLPHDCFWCQVRGCQLIFLKMANFVSIAYCAGSRVANRP